MTFCYFSVLIHIHLKKTRFLNAYLFQANDHQNNRSQATFFFFFNSLGLTECELIFLRYFCLHI